MRTRLAFALVFLMGAAPPRVVTPTLIPDDPQASSANVAALQSAVDQQQANFHGVSASKIVIPPGDYYFNAPVFFDGGNVGLQGAGKGVTRLVNVGGHDLIVVGVSRNPNVPGVKADLTPDHFVPGIAGRVGFRTLADHHLAQQGGTLDDYGSGLKQLTIESCVDLTHLRDAGGSYARGSSASLFGLSDRGVQSPWEMALGNDSYILKMRSSTGKYGQFVFGRIAQTTGVVRLTVQVDLASSKVDAWIDDARVFTGKAPADFAEFAANEHCPFGIGSNSMMANNVADYFGGASDITFLGLKITKGLIYKSDDKLTRLDGKAFDDSRYFTIEPKTLGFLSLNEKPGDVAKNRVMSATGQGFAGSTVYALHNAAHGSPWSSTSPGPFRDITLASWGKTGRGITTGFTQGLDVRNCEVFGGRGGIGSLNFGVNYPVTIMDTSLGGRDAPLDLTDSYFCRIENISLPTTFRCGMRFVRMSGTIRNVFSPAWGEPDYYIKADESSVYISDSNFDNEGSGAQVAPLCFSPDGTYPTIVRVERCNFAVYSPAAPLVLLNDRNTAYGCRFSINDCPDVIRGGLGSGRIDAKGTRWKVAKDY